MLGAHSTFSVKGIHRGLKRLWWCVGEEAFQTQQTSSIVSPFPPADLPDTAGWERLWVPVASRGGTCREQAVRALCRHKGFHLEGSVFPRGNRGAGTLALRLISYHNKGYSGTLLESDAAVGHSRAVSWAREERTSLWSEHHVFRPSGDKEALR